MGKGLAAILPVRDSKDAELREIPVGMIKPNPRQPRERFDAASISDLARSISDAGVIQPLLLRAVADGRYELIAGERRWRAAREAGLGSVPAVVRDDDEVGRLETALIENVVREDLNPVDEARACSALVEDLGLTKEDLGRRLGRSRPAISNLIRLLDLPQEVLELLSSGRLSEGHGRALLQVQGNDERRRLGREAASRGWSVRELERRVSSGPAGRRGKVVLHPDQEAAIEDATEALERALGRGAKIRVTRRGVRAEIDFEDLDEVRDLIARLAS